MAFPKPMGSKAGPAWQILAPAKLNLHLEVLGRRSDGFHDLETLMVPVRIYDQLVYTADPREPLSLRVRPLSAGVSNHKVLGPSEDNLVTRAASLLAQSAGITPTGTFDLYKRIPIQAGMGGGSSDAAAALQLANEAWQLGKTREELMTLGAELGSDVPFFLGDGSAIGRGRGELLEPVSLPRLHFVVAKPPQGLSTPKVFAELSKHLQAADEQRRESHQARLLSLLAALRRGSLSEAAGLMSNRLESAACALAPWLAKLSKLFLKLGCLGQFMTGSGSAYVGVMRSAKHAQQAGARLRNIHRNAGIEVGQVFATSSC